MSTLSNIIDEVAKIAGFFREQCDDLKPSSRQNRSQIKLNLDLIHLKSDAIKRFIVDLIELGDSSSVKPLEVISKAVQTHFDAIEALYNLILLIIEQLHRLKELAQVSGLDLSNIGLKFIASLSSSDMTTLSSDMRQIMRIQPAVIGFIVHSTQASFVFDPAAAIRTLLPSMITENLNYHQLVNLQTLMRELIPCLSFIVCNSSKILDIYFATSTTNEADVKIVVSYTSKYELETPLSTLIYWQYIPQYSSLSFDTEDEESLFSLFREHNFSEYRQLLIDFNDVNVLELIKQCEDIIAIMPSAVRSAKGDLEPLLRIYKKCIAYSPCYATYLEYCRDGFIALSDKRRVAVYEDLCSFELFMSKKGDEGSEHSPLDSLPKPAATPTTKASSSTATAAPEVRTPLVTSGVVKQGDVIVHCSGKSVSHPSALNDAEFGSMAGIVRNVLSCQLYFVTCIHVVEGAQKSGAVTIDGDTIAPSMRSKYLDLVLPSPGGKKYDLIAAADSKYIDKRVSAGFLDALLNGYSKAAVLSLIRSGDQAIAGSLTVEEVAHYLNRGVISLRVLLSEIVQLDHLVQIEVANDVMIDISGDISLVPIPHDLEAYFHPPSTEDGPKSIVWKQLTLKQIYSELFGGAKNTIHVYLNGATTSTANRPKGIIRRPIHIKPADPGANIGSVMLRDFRSPESRKVYYSQLVVRADTGFGRPGDSGGLVFAENVDGNERSLVGVLVGHFLEHFYVVSPAELVNDSGKYEWVL